MRFCEEYYLKNGTWYRCVFTQGGWVEDPEPSPYLDEDGKPENPIEAISAYIDRDNNRYGEVRAMISPQDEYNKRRSKYLHRASSRQVRVSPGAAVAGGNDPTTIKRELAKPDGLMIADEGMVEILNNSDLSVAEFNLLQHAQTELDHIGPNASLQGKNDSDSSGRQTTANQQGGMVEVALLMDRLRQLSLSVYRSLWARIRQYWTEERWIRVTDDERDVKWVGLNKPMTMIEMAAEKLQGDPQAEAKLQLLSQDPRAQQVMEVKNPVAEIDVDIVIDEGMDTPMVQAEQFDTLTKIMPSLIQMPPQYAEMLVQASSLRDKDKMLEILQKTQQGAQIPPEIQQQIQEMQQALQQLSQENQALKLDQQGKQADVMLKGEEIKLKHGELELKAKEIEQKDDELKLDAYRAATERHVAMNPPQPQQPQQGSVQ